MKKLIFVLAFALLLAPISSYADTKGSVSVTAHKEEEKVVPKEEPPSPPVVNTPEETPKVEKKADTEVIAEVNPEPKKEEPKEEEVLPEVKFPERPAPVVEETTPEPVAATPIEEDYDVIIEEEYVPLIVKIATPIKYFFWSLFARESFQRPQYVESWIITLATVMTFFSLLSVILVLILKRKDNDDDEEGQAHSLTL